LWARLFVRTYLFMRRYIHWFYYILWCKNQIFIYKGLKVTRKHAKIIWVL
jgi:hypothetical protein